MRQTFLLFITIFIVAAGFLLDSAFAGEPEAKATALAYSCKPTKLETIGQTVGLSATITYLATCETKVAGSQPQQLRIRCEEKMCVILR